MEQGIESTIIGRQEPNDQRRDERNTRDDEFEFLIFLFVRPFLRFVQNGNVDAAENHFQIRIFSWQRVGNLRQKQRILMHLFRDETQTFAGR